MASKSPINTEQLSKKPSGKKSIFYDPDWNIEGIPPSGEKFIPYNPNTFKRRNELKTRLAGLSPENWKEIK